MFIKHWQGYGRVKATKTGSVTRKTTTQEYWEFGCEKVKVLTIKVEGEHEWGLERNDVYDVFNWLVTKFDKSFTDYRDIVSMQIDSESFTCCHYIIKLKVK